MTNPLKWTRSEKMIGKDKSVKTGLSVYTSTDGRFVIRQTRAPGWTSTRTYYLLDVDGKPAHPVFRESDTLQQAKDAANLIANPNHEPV